VFYCSQDCQRAAWSAHSKECPALAALRAARSVTPPPALRLAHNSLRAVAAPVATPAASIALFHALVSHREEVGEAALVAAAEQAALLFSYAGSPPGTSEPWRLNFSLTEATRVLLQLSCNAHSVCDAELRPTGRGVYPLLACANHDCAPSCVLTFRGAKAQLRAARPLDAGDEVTLAYVDLCASRRERRNELRSGYYFECTCARCAGGGADPLGGSSPAAAAALAEARRLREAAAGEAAAAAAAALALADAPPALSRHCALRTRILDECMRCAIEAGDWAAALRHGEASLPGYEAAYGRGVTGGAHPLLGLQRAAVGRLRWATGDCRGAAEELERAAALLRVTHGADCELVGSLRQSCLEAQAAAAHAARAGGLE